MSGYKINLINKIAGINKAKSFSNGNFISERPVLKFKNRSAMKITK